MAANVVDGGWDSDERSIVSLGFSYVGWSGRRAVFVFLEEVECCLNMVSSLGD